MLSPAAILFITNVMLSSCMLLVAVLFSSFAAIEHIRYRQMVAFGMPFQFQACIFDGGWQDGDSNQGVFLDVSPCYECQSFALMVSKRDIPTMLLPVSFL